MDPHDAGPTVITAPFLLMSYLNLLVKSVRIISSFDLLIRGIAFICTGEQFDYAAPRTNL